MSERVVVVGAGQAGAQVAVSLRQGGHRGPITVIGDEPDPPYERPPLSKDYLAGTRDCDRLRLRPLDFWVSRDIDLVLGTRVVGVDAIDRSVATDRGERFGYDALVWAAGGVARRLTCPGAALDGVHAIRARADVDRLRADLTSARAVAIVGAGYVGLEAAAVLVSAGKAVTVVEAQDRVLARVAGPPLSRFYETEHRAHGVDVRLAAAVVEIVGGRDGRVAGVCLGDGEIVDADVVIAGVGIVPTVEPLAAAGAAVGNGLEVDEYCRTTLPDVFAIGDCANHPNRYARCRVRLESVQNAVDQAKVVAGVLLGEPKPYAAVPWFWSNQYDLRLQTAGLLLGHDRTEVRGDPATRSWSLAYFAGDRMVAIDCVNATRDYVQGKAMIDIMAASAALPDPATANGPDEGVALAFVARNYR